MVEEMRPITLAHFASILLLKYPEKHDVRSWSCFLICCCGGGLLRIISRWWRENRHPLSLWKPVAGGDATIGAAPTGRRKLKRESGMTTAVLPSIPKRVYY